MEDLLVYIHRVQYVTRNNGKTCFQDHLLLEVMGLASSGSQIFDKEKKPKIRLNSPLPLTLITGVLTKSKGIQSCNVCAFEN